MSETAYERVIGALHRRGARINYRPGRRGEADAQCPAHDDNNPSLGVTDRGDRVLIICRSRNCKPKDIVAALGLTMPDLFNEPPTYNKPIRYAYDDGRVVKRSYNSDGRKTLPQEHTEGTPTLYHASRLADVPPNRHVYLVEGEEDVHTLEAHGIVATTAPMGARNFGKVDVRPLAGKLVVCVVDRDEDGDAWATQVAQKLQGVAQAFKFVRAAVGKDASDHFAAGLDETAFEPYEPLTASDDAGSAGRPLYVDVAALLAGGIPDPPAPVLLHRDDGKALFYGGKVNVVYGDPESGKTWIALAAIVEALRDGRRAVFVDLDHNGVAEIVSRLLLLGAKPADLGDLEAFRYAEPEDAEELILLIADLRSWRPAVAVVDSIGELLPMLGLSSNSPDDYTSANRRVLVPLSTAGAATIAVDHLPKDDSAREKGQTGTAAKRRTVNGITLRVTATDPFAPGHGGAASMTIGKDRPGGVRAHCPVGRNPPAGRFVLTAYPDGSVSWHVTAPSAVTSGTPDDDIAELDGLDPPPKSQRDVQERCGWGGTRALMALRKWRELRKPEDL